jgi:DNA-binding transcriptional LysR family regulator
MMRDVPWAEELTQEALLAALEQWPATGVPEKPGAWLMTTARRRAADHLRRNRMLERKHELVALDMEQQQQAMPEASLASGSVDLAIDIALPHSEEIRRQRLAADRMAVVARHGHPQMRQGLELETYLAQDHVMVTSRRKGPGLEDVELGTRGLKRRVRLRCRNYLAALRAVAETDLVLTMAERYAGALSAGLDIRILPLRFRMPTLDLHLYWHSSVDGDAANRWLRGQVVGAFKTG